MKRAFQLTALCGQLFFVPAAVAAPVRAVPAELVRSVDPIRTQLQQADLWPIQAVVLDMDGVTTPNSGALWTERGQEFLREVAPAWEEGDLRSIKWKSLPDVHRWISENRGARLSYEEYVRRREELAARIYGVLAQLEPSLRETRDVLKAGAVPVALASANTRFSVDSMLQRFQLDGVFDATASSDELPPAERDLGKSRTHLLAARRLGVPPNRSLAIEDTPDGVRAALKAGMAVAGFRNGFNEGEDLSAAHFQIRRLSDILPLFDRSEERGER